jgi:hypothetical protein
LKLSGALYPVNNPSAAGNIYLTKQLEHLNQQAYVLYLFNDAGHRKPSFVEKIYISRWFEYFSRLPCMVILKLFFIRLIAPRIVSRLVLNEKFTAVLIMTTSDLLTLEVGRLLKLQSHVRELHLSMYDLPWTYPTTNINKRFIKAWFKHYLQEIDAVDCVTDAMLELVLNLSSDIKRRFITHSSVGLCSAKIKKVCTMKLLDRKRGFL